MRKLLTLTLALLLLVAGCNEQDPGPQLPPETQTGAGTLGFKIGDRIFVAKTARAIVLIQGNMTVDITSGNEQEQWGLRVGTDSLFSTGTYAIDTFRLSPPPARTIGAGAFLIDGCSFYTTTGMYSGQLTITRLDYQAGIVSGRFFMSPVGNATCGQRMITDGRFDVRF